MPVPAQGHTHPVYTERRLNARAILQRRDVKSLHELRWLRKLGWSEDSLDDAFRSQRHRADNPPPEAKYFWYDSMARIMRELDAEAHFILPSEPFEFLDVGCAPGGFSAHVLRTNPQARGVGLSLPESQGGHTFLLEPIFWPRYEYVEQDMLEYDFRPVQDNAQGHSDVGPTLPTAFLDRFQLVLLDGHPLRTYSPTPWPNQAAGAYTGALLISQLIIALSCVRSGGAIVVKLDHIEGCPAAQLLFLLQDISESLVVHKPRTMHASRASFYAIAKGVGAGEDATLLKEFYLEQLKALWYKLRYGGPGGGARGLTEADLDFVVSADDILDGEGNLDKLIGFGESVWAMQADGLRRFFGKKGMHGLPGSV
ncbi:hypothetical protein OH77DRAFT_1427519 [Trametes cingulata]|nr:hypothetical protein OH77DRAFT_1427519 [Trametes cingulata]